MDVSQLKQLIELFEKSSVGEMEIEQGDFRVRLRRNSRGEITVQQGEVGTAAVAEPDITAGTHDDGSLPESNLITIDAPMVGVFYSAPAPNEKPFVRIGQSIEEGQTVAIISAMKVMNEIKSEISGTVREVLVENGQAVEYGQPLFAVEPG